ncbi:MAG: amidoligase family protein [Lachnospiraceae bacterium]|nr:amidoligase family protein [Lachnospiraceae bacterium]
MEEREVFICPHCGEEHEICDGYEMGEEIYCCNCIDDLTVVCQDCGERIWADNDAGDENISLCQSCYDRNYTTCSRCDRLIHVNDAYYEDDDEDEPYCYNCHIQYDSSTSLHGYSYRPDPIFYGEGNRYLGVELEIDRGGKSSYHAQKICEVANGEEELIYIKTDGSLDDGLEIVTHPMTLDYHMTQTPWQAIVNKALELGYKSHQTSTTGLHCHVNRTSLGETVEEQEVTISKVLFFVERFWDELLRFSRRTEYQVNRWAARYGLKERPKDVLDHAKKSGLGRYSCVNITNYETIEFRLFRGTVEYNAIIATLQLVNEICNVAFLMTESELSVMSWHGFLERLTQPELITYLKERRLYVNEPVETEEDD